MFDLNQFSLKDKIAIVTGGGRGIGQAIAFGLAKAGAKVVITSRKINDLEATAQEIKAAGGEALPLQSHLGKYEEIQKMINAVLEKYKRIDILINNAGASPAMASVLDSDERLWDTTMNLNLKGVYFVSQAVAKIMKKQGGGKIINIASIDGHKPEPGVSIYSISKAGVRMITKAFAMELAGDNIQVNAIAPGPISTKMMNSHWFHLSPEEAKKAKETMEKSLPAGRIGMPDEIAGAAVYLASDASNYTTGAEIIIDGGLLLAHHA
ncbi:MAG TPA: glucose 1-dehydrogenase [Smithellaceae bacterium]|jgi:NAD(P)-dependent dehydrogenase (short-subunit alcohol dehydrogenase family)|nr:glucose 1-dehydrogenase [Smithellaceae bacterium]HNZ31505.1 glucose 1-dehydrogenase [Smithellaceae bacterium]HOF78602.1 glucose 1-dehydrogenase [Smithellaceae bacterium]HOM69794.1 glucose 1-dehydrogenase [Smithellaceae bacterium]HOS09565.1 glucose 1-dehydrogenase [Smithellaceae bacterium]